MSKNGDAIGGNGVNWALSVRMLLMLSVVVAYFGYMLFILGSQEKATDAFVFDIDLPDNNYISDAAIVSNDGFVRIASGGQSGVGRFDLPQRIIRPTKELPIPEYIERIYEVRLYSYYPPVDDNFCLDYDHANQDCLSTMTSGLDWREYNQGALACPEKWLGETLTLAGENINGFIPCLDTGTAATCENGMCTLFLLDSSLRYRGERLVVYR